MRCSEFRWVVLALAALINVAPSPADQEASNVAHVTASKYGRCYAKSVPTDLYGVEGTTHIYLVGPSEDVLAASYDWFSQQIYIACNVSDGKTPTGISVVRFGPWARGRTAKSEDLAFGFYFKGQELKEFSTLDIAGSPDNVSASVSHYTVIDEVIGYERAGGNQYAFRVKTTDSRTLSFDPATGERLAAEGTGQSAR